MEIGKGKVDIPTEAYLAVLKRSKFLNNMFGSKQVKVLWTIISIIGILAMIFFSMLPAFQY